MSISLALIVSGGCSNDRGSSAGQLSDPTVWGLADVQLQHEPAAEHCVQEELNSIEDPAERFEAAFDCGDELFETVFNSLDGVGALVGAGQRFSRIPRADLTGPGEWATHTPERATGPNAQACNHCHGLPFDDGAGFASANVHRDPLHTGVLAQFIQRNTPHVFAPGALQVLAEEMTEALHGQRDAARDSACKSGYPVTAELEAKGVQFGSITVNCDGTDDTSAVSGVNADLIVRPFQWKGSVATLRDFNRGAGHNELGMQAVEITGDDVDGDSDGVVNELIVGDMSALAVYLAAQPRPVTRLELRDLGLLEVTPEEAAAIERGAVVFDEVGCDDCHKPRLDLAEPIFAEPSTNTSFRDATFPAGQDPIERGVDPANPIAFDLTADQPDNVLETPEGEIHFGSLEGDGKGGGIARLFGDLKTHDMGPGLAEGIDEVGTGASVFLTENLWGVGSTAPYLHDGRATTLTEAIVAHGGEGDESRAQFQARSEAEQADLIAFLDNLVLFKLPEAEEAE